MSLKRLYAIDIPVLITLGNKIYPPDYTSRIIICNTETILKLANVVKILVPAAKISTYSSLHEHQNVLSEGHK